MTKAAAAAKKFLDEVREKADRKAEEAPREPGHGDPKPETPLHDERGLFRPGHEKVGGRQAGTPNRIPRSIKEVMLKLAEGVATLEGDSETFADKVARALALGMDGKLILSRNAGHFGESVRYEPRLGYVLAFLEYGIKHADKLGAGGSGARSGPKIVFMGEAHDPMARPGAPPEPLRMLGQIRRADGVIVNYATGQPVVSAPKRTDALRNENAGTREDDDDLEVLEDVDPHPNCPHCRGSGRQRAGFRDRTEPCSECGGTGKAQVS